MSLSLPVAHTRLTREMREAEAQIAEALVSTTALMHSFALAAREHDAPAHQVHAAFLQLQKLTGNIVEARAESLRTHGKLSELAITCGFAEPCPEDEVFKTASADDDIAAA